MANIQTVDVHGSVSSNSDVFGAGFHVSTSVAQRSFFLKLGSKGG